MSFGQKNGGIREEVDAAKRPDWIREEEDPITENKIAITLQLHNGRAMQFQHSRIASGALELRDDL
jgi:hypothetical protein